MQNTTVDIANNQGAQNASLANIFGFDQFRGGQQQVVSQLLNGQSSLAIFPTGSGKSLCYQFCALHLPHLTLVVSPLLALMKDQLAFLQSKGIAAGSIDSTLSPDEQRSNMERVRSGEIKILMVSVERFKNERFRQFIDSIAVSMLVVDEAHCISEWGHNFRPDYLKLPDYRAQLNIPLVLLLTATATKKVKLDMAKRFAIEPQHIVQTGFYRENLDLQVIATPERGKNQTLLQIIQAQQGCGIVYVTLQHSAEQVAQRLAVDGVSAKAYHAGLGDEIRQQVQQDFMEGRIQVVVATIAFGMGIDKSDIRFVVHYDLPKSIENYSQEIGRAGRDDQLSHCITLGNLDGLHTVENFVYGDTPELQGIQILLDDIRQGTQNHIAKPTGQHATQYENEGATEFVNGSQWELQINGLSTLSNIRQLPLKTLLVQLELMGIVRPQYAYFADVRFKFLQDKVDVLARFDENRQAFLTSVFANTDFKKVWGSLNFDSLFEQTGAERARVVAALEYLAQNQLIELQTKQMTEVFQVDTDKLNQPELAQTLHAYFTDKEQKELQRIAMLVRFFQLDQCLSHNLSRYFDDLNAPEKCGHCSVCRGQVAHLQVTNEVPEIDELAVAEAMQALAKHIEGKVEYRLREDTYCRFLTGMTMPLFTRLKIRQVRGYAMCEKSRYPAIKEVVRRFLADNVNQ